MAQARLDTLNSVTDAYAHLVAEGKIRHDPVQAMIAGRLDRVRADIDSLRLAEKKSALGWLFGRKLRKVRGLYIHGSVGRGKTMLMDLFFERVGMPGAQSFMPSIVSWLFSIKNISGSVEIREKMPVDQITVGK